MFKELPWSRRKVFCVGRNKTGTTSLASVMTSLGYRAGDQPKAELLIEDWARGDYDAIGRLCRRRDFFQDIPFSLAGTFKAMDQAFPKSRFILTVRSNSEVWYESLLRFHTKLIGAGRLPTADDLRAFEYRAPLTGSGEPSGRSMGWSTGFLGGNCGRRVEEGGTSEYPRSA